MATWSFMMLLLSVGTAAGVKSRGLGYSRLAGAVIGLLGGDSVATVKVTAPPPGGLASIVLSFAGGGNADSGWLKQPLWVGP